MKYALLLILPLLMLCIPVHAATINITTIADSSAYTGYSNSANGTAYNTTNFGSAIMGISNGNATMYNGGRADSYMMFNTSIIPSNAVINWAYLHIKTNVGTQNGAIRYIDVYNTSLNWSETNITGLLSPIKKTLQENNSITIQTTSTWLPAMNISNALRTAIFTGSNMSLFLGFDNYNQYPQDSISIYSRESANVPYIEVSFTTPDNCNTTILGTYCDPADALSVGGSGRGILTTPDYTCQNDKYYTCPSGTLCTQILPQVNITTPIVEDLVDCSRCWYQKINVGTFLNPIWQTRYTNCEAYPQCDNCNGAFCYGNTFQSNLSTTPVSLNQYAAGCVNSVGTVINIVLGNGTNTTVQNITDEIFPDANYTYNVTMPTCTNTSTTCYDINCIQINCAVIVSDNYADQIALVIGSTVGVQDLATARTMSSILMTMLGAAGVLMLFASMKIHGQILGQSFLISLLMFLVLFTLIGWFPSWLMVILMVISGLMIAKTLKVF